MNPEFSQFCRHQTPATEQMNPEFSQCCRHQTPATEQMNPEFSQFCRYQTAATEQMNPEFNQFCRHQTPATEQMNPRIQSVLQIVNTSDRVNESLNSVTLVRSADTKQQRVASESQNSVSSADTIQQRRPRSSRRTNNTRIRQRDKYLFISDSNTSRHTCDMRDKRFPISHADA